MKIECDCPVAMPSFLETIRTREHEDMCPQHKAVEKLNAQSKHREALALRLSPAKSLLTKSRSS